jgi:hypothetical protein
MTSDQQRALLDIASAQTPDGPPTPSEAESLEESALRYRVWVSERDRNLRQNAAAVLNPAQLKTLHDSRQIRESIEKPMITGIRPANRKYFAVS